MFDACCLRIICHPLVSDKSSSSRHFFALSGSDMCPSVWYLLGLFVNPPRASRPANGIGLSISPADWKGPSFFILLLLQPPLSMDRVHVSLAPFKGFFAPPRYMAMPPDPITLWPWPAYIYPSSFPFDMIDGEGRTWSAFSCCQ